MKFQSRRTIARALAAAGATLLLSFGSIASAQDVKKAKLGHSFADSHPRAVAMKQFATAVSKATNGKVVIDVYGNSMLGSEERMLIAVRSGVQDLYLGAVSQIFEFPFLFGSDAEAAYVLDGPIGRKMLDSLGDMHGLVWAGGAFRNKLEKIRSAVQPVIDKNSETIGKDFVQAVYGELKKFRAGGR